MSNPVDQNQAIEAIYTETLMLQESNWAMQLDSLLDIPIMGRNDSAYTLHNVSRGKNLILYLNASMCSPCVEHELENFATLVQRAGVQGIVLTEGYRGQYVFRDPVFTKSGLKTYSIKNPFFGKAQKIYTPVILYTNEGGRVMIAYNTPKNFPSLNEALVQAINN